VRICGRLEILDDTIQGDRLPAPLDPANYEPRALPDAERVGRPACELGIEQTGRRARRRGWTHAVSVGLIESEPLEGGAASGGAADDQHVVGVVVADVAVQVLIEAQRAERPAFGGEMVDVHHVGRAAGDRADHLPVDRVVVRPRERPGAGDDIGIDRILHRRRLGRQRKTSAVRARVDVAEVAEHDVAGDQGVSVQWLRREDSGYCRTARLDVDRPGSECALGDAIADLDAPRRSCQKSEQTGQRRGSRCPSMLHQCSPAAGVGLEWFRRAGQGRSGPLRPGRPSYTARGSTREPTVVRMCVTLRCTAVRTLDEYKPRIRCRAIAPKVGRSVRRGGGYAPLHRAGQSVYPSTIVRDASPTSYDDVPYDSHPIWVTHPDHLAVIATLAGMRPAPVEHCRVLELGCASGGNLIPMAVALPESQFVGIDLSPAQVADGQATIAALGVRNVTLEAQSILDLDESIGTFDYIVCHGVYSWVPPAVQDGILAVFARHLAPQGVAYVSYNTHPGWHLRGMVRDMMLFHAARFTEPVERIRQAR